MKRVIEELVDDLDGGKAAATIKFTWQGVAYSIDLSDDNADKFNAAMQPWIEAASRDRSGARPDLRIVRNPTARTGDREKNAAVRAWAKEQGKEVSDRGRISADIIREYEEARSNPTPEGTSARRTTRRKPADKAAEGAKDKATA